MDQIIDSFNNIESQIGEIGGKAIIIEHKMRLIAEYTPEILNELSNDKRKKNKEHSSCDLKLLVELIAKQYSIDKNQLLYAVEVRDTIFHCNFSKERQKDFGIKAFGRELLPDGSRNILDPNQIGEVIKFLGRTDFLANFIKLIKNVDNDLNEIIRSFKRSNNFTKKYKQ